MIRRVVTALLEGVALGTLQYAPFAPATGYAAFFTVLVYLGALTLLPARGGRRSSRRRDGAGRGGARRSSSRPAAHDPPRRRLGAARRGAADPQRPRRRRAGARGVGGRGGRGRRARRSRAHAGRGVLMPGLVNAHCHLELSYLRGRLPKGAGFVPWVESVVLARGTVPEEQMAAATAAGVAELKECGHHRRGRRVQHARRRCPAAGRAPARGGPARAAGLGPGGGGAGADRRAGPDRRGRARAGGVRLAAHAPHSVSPALLALLVEGGGPAGIHLAESPDEVAFLQAGDGAWGAFLERRGLGHVRFPPPRASPVAYADAAGALHPGLIAAHCVQAGADDLRLLARRGVHVAVCPRSNLAPRRGPAAAPGDARGRHQRVRGHGQPGQRGHPERARRRGRAAPRVPRRPARAARGDRHPERRRRPRARRHGRDRPGMAAALAYAPSPAVVDDPEAFVVSGRARLRPVAA